jgi:HEAT repeat protein
MKYARIAIAALFVLSCAVAATPVNGQTKVDWKKAAENYIADLKSENPGVQASAASHIREYKLEGAVEELKDLLSNTHENVRMSAAFALVVVGGDDGRTAVENAIPKEENEIVSTFYRSILTQPAAAQN